MTTTTTVYLGSITVDTLIHRDGVAMASTAVYSSARVAAIVISSNNPASLTRLGEELIDAASKLEILQRTAQAADQPEGCGDAA